MATKMLSQLDVIFRKYRDKKTKKWEVVAFFPETMTRYQYMDSYEHCGQHGLAHIDYYWKCKPCKDEEYKELLDELRRVGYDKLNIVKRINYKKIFF